MKFLIVLGLALGIISCTNEKSEDASAFKEKMKGHWYCAPDSDYQEIIFTDSAFIAHGMAYGTMFRYVKYISPDSVHFYDGDVLVNCSKISFKDSTMTATFNGGQTDYTLISRLADHERDYQLLFKGDKTAHSILHWEWQARMIAWANHIKFSKWQVNEKLYTSDEKIDLLSKVDDSFVEATLTADDAYKSSTLPLFHFFDADADGKEEIAFWGTAGAANEFFKLYKTDGVQYKPWVYEIGRLIQCASYRDTTWVEIYSPVMIGDHESTDSVITYTITKNLKKRAAR